MDRYFVFTGGFGKEVYLKGMDMKLLMHLKGITIQYPFDIFCVVHVMMHIDITVTDLEKILLLGMNGTRDLFRFLYLSRKIEQVQNPV